MFVNNHQQLPEGIMPVFVFIFKTVYLESNQDIQLSSWSCKILIGYFHTHNIASVSSSANISSSANTSANMASASSSANILVS